MEDRKLTDEEAERFVRWMSGHEDSDWGEFARWAKEEFGVELTEEECCRLFIEAAL